MPKTISLTLTPQEFALLKDAMDELCNDSDLIWGNEDEAHCQRRYEEAKRLADRLEKIGQMVVIPY
jgi:hypothetical protein